MVFQKANRTRFVTALVLTLVVAALGLVWCAPEGPLGDGLVRASYDTLHQIRGTQEAAVEDCPVVLVYLDLNSYGLLGQDPSRPWSRELHAQLLQKLTRAAAKVVVVDIVFSTSGERPEADDAFVAAIRKNARTILAGESSSKISHVTGANAEWTRASTIDPPWQPFRQAAAGWGVASHIVDDDYVVRRYAAGGFGPERQPSLTWAVAEFLRLAIAAPPEAMTRANGAILRYYGPPLTIPHVSYAEALATHGTPEHFFRDKIVVIGARPLTKFFRGRQDEFRSPFHSWGHKELFVPGVEVHATELLNLIRGDWLRRLSPTVEAVWLLLVAVVLGGLMWLRPVGATIAALMGAGTVLGVAFAAFDKGTWFPWLIVAGAQIPMALAGSVLFHSVEWYRARRLYEARIREQAALLDKANDAILVQTLDGKVLYANPSAERLFGWRLDELQKADVVEELFSPMPDAAKNARAAAFQTGEWNGELRQQTKSGRLVIVASRWTLIRDARGHPQQLLLINSDITERKELEAQFLRTQRLNTIGTLAGGMAHDLNNALAPILMGTQLLRRHAQDNETRKLLGLMEINTQRGADMVRQVLLFARGRGGEFERLDLGLLVKELEKLVQETFPKRIAVEAFLPGDLWPVRGNPTQLHQVLLNLCVNARDAMPSGGKLSFVADNVTLGAAEAGKIPNGCAGEFVSISISDTGTGMSPDVLARVFEPFFSTKGEGRGTGIGLSTVARIVKAHQGFWRVESEPDVGTTFEVFLPRAAATAAVETADQPKELPRGKGELILVADDEQAIRDLMKSELESFGYRVLSASNGAEAVALFHKHEPDVRLFITDNAMPVMDGRQAIAELHKLKSGLPVILTSGESREPMTQGVTELNKPFALEELLGTIRRSLGE